MDDAIKRSVERQFPELTGGYHLPRFAKVVAVADAPYPRHKPHLAKNEDLVYRGISGEQFHGNKAS
ncbi:hypothetical protein ACMZYR_17420, partial [Pseudomonas syringae pv. actinidiae]